MQIPTRIINEITVARADIDRIYWSKAKYIGGDVDRWTVPIAADFSDEGEGEGWLSGNLFIELDGDFLDYYVGDWS